MSAIQEYLSDGKLVTELTIRSKSAEDKIELSRIDELFHGIAKKHLEQENLSTAAFVIHLMTGNTKKEEYCDTAEKLFNACMKSNRYMDAIKAAFLINQKESISKQLLLIANKHCGKDCDLAFSALSLVQLEKHRGLRECLDRAVRAIAPPPAPIVIEAEPQQPPMILEPLARRLSVTGA